MEQEPVPQVERHESNERLSSDSIERLKSGEIDEALQELESTEGGKEVFGDTAALGAMGSNDSPQATRLLSVCAALWAQQNPGKDTGKKFLTAYRIWAGKNGSMGMQVTERLLERLNAHTGQTFAKGLTPADSFQQLLATTLGFTAHLGELSRERYDIALRAAMWAHIKAGQEIPPLGEVAKIFQQTIKLWHAEIERFEQEQHSAERAYAAILGSDDEPRV